MPQGNSDHSILDSLNYQKKKKKKKNKKNK